jgi:hypothetical protein
VAKVWVSERTLGSRNRRVLDAAITRVESILEGDLLAVVVQDEDGLYFLFRPGAERLIASRLEEVNWHSLRLLTDEHYP